MPMKNDEKIVINILESFKEKLVSKKQLARALRNVLQDKYSESIIVKLRQLLHFYTLQATTESITVIIENGVIIDPTLPYSTPWAEDFCEYCCDC